CGGADPGRENVIGPRLKVKEWRREWRAGWIFGLGVLWARPFSFGLVVSGLAAGRFERLVRLMYRMWSLIHVNLSVMWLQLASSDVRRGSGSGPAPRDRFGAAAPNRSRGPNGLHPHPARV